MKFKFYALKLVGVIIVVFILQLLIRGFTELLVLDQNSFIQPWRFVSAIFLHASLTHLIFNMFALALFGSILEKYVGGKRFLLIFFATGIIANLFSVFFYPSSLGASGAIMGVIGTLVILSPLMVVWAFGLPMPMFIAGILWALGDLLGVFNSTSNVGHIAHLSGMVVGLIIGYFFRDKRQRVSKGVRITLDENYMRKWEDYYLK